MWTLGRFVIEFEVNIRTCCSFWLGWSQRPRFRSWLTNQISLGIMNNHRQSDTQYNCKTTDHNWPPKGHKIITQYAQIAVRCCVRCSIYAMLCTNVLTDISTASSFIWGCVLAIVRWCHLVISLWVYSHVAAQQCKTAAHQRQSQRQSWLNEIVINTAKILLETLTLVHGISHRTCVESGPT